VRLVLWFVFIRTNYHIFDCDCGSFFLNINKGLCKGGKKHSWLI
jgi:hypothetical protein